MPRYDYGPIQATAKRLIDRFGRDMTLRARSHGTYNPATATVTRTQTDYPAIGYLDQYAQEDIDGTLIQVGDQRVIMSPTVPVEPKTGDALVIDSDEWEIVRSQPLKPATTLLLYELQVRRD